MKTTIYWAMRHGCRAMHELRFRATCWWLSQQVEFLEWRMRREVLMPTAEPNPVPTLVGKGEHYAALLNVAEPV
jgi:hypothetical protein